MLLCMLVIPLAASYFLFVLALHEGGQTGSSVQSRGVADVSGCHSPVRLLGLVQECTATNVVLGKDYPRGPTHAVPGKRMLLTRTDVANGRVPVVELCVLVGDRAVTQEKCTLYPANFPRSVWWAWLGYVTIPVAILLYFGLRARGDARRLRRRPATGAVSLDKPVSRPEPTQLSYEEESQG